MHPTLTIDETRRLTSDFLDDAEVDLVSPVKWVGPSPEVDLTSLHALAAELRDELVQFQETDNTDKDAFEGAAAGRLHKALQHLPLDVLDDAAFWRYVTVVHLWEFTRWREEKAFRKDWADYRVYVDGRRQSECIPLRMFLRGRLAEMDADYSLASQIPQATDLWRSHILRVRTSYSPVLTRALLRQQRDNRMNTDELRAYAKRLQRVASNVVLHTYDDSDAVALLTDLREDSP